MSDDILFQHAEAEISVTRHWLKIGNQSHAIHYLRRLTLDEWQPPRQVAMIVFFIGLLLAIIQVIQIVRGTLPEAVSWFLLLACVALMIVSSYIAFVQADKHKLQVDFNDGESIQLALPGKGNILRLHAALQEAMDSHPDRKLSAIKGIIKELES